MTKLCSLAAVAILAVGVVLATSPGDPVRRAYLLFDDELKTEPASLVRKAPESRPADRTAVAAGDPLPAVLTPVTGDIEDGMPTRHFSITVGTADSGLEAEASPVLQRWEGEVRQGDTLAALLESQGISPEEASAAASALGSVYDGKQIKAGQQVILALAPSLDGRLGEERNKLIELTLSPSPVADHVVTRTPKGFAAASVERPLTRHLVYRDGVINGSFFGAGKSAGVPYSMLTRLVKAFSYDVDFQRDLRAGDRFEVAFEAFVNDRGQMANTGKVVFGALELSGRRKEVYAFTPKSGHTDFFSAQGESVRKALLRTPVDGARISSKFGMRRHPILGYSKMHKGVDFAAPTGTPIFAAGDGVVKLAKWHGGYGRYVRLRHSNGYDTAYAHMSRFAKGIRSGKRVRQGQVIGYVGTTGRSTGPHLHYEVLAAGKQVNPLSVKLLPGEKLKGDDLKRFRQIVDQIQQARSEGSQIFMANRQGQ